MKKILFLLAITSFAFVGCDKEDETKTENDSELLLSDLNTDKTGQVRIYLENIANTTAPNHGHVGKISTGGHGSGVAFEISDNKFVSAEGDTFGLSKFQYLLTDFKVTYEGKEYSADKSAFYVKQDQDNTTNELYRFINDVPIGTYSDLSFLLGLNDQDNVTDNTSGELADAYNDGMVWSWSTGYKFARIEGEVKVNGVDSSFVQHIGTSENKREIVIDNQFTIKEDTITELHLQINISDLFEGVSLKPGASHGGGHSAHGTSKTTNNDKATIMDNLSSFLESPHHFMTTTEPVE